MTEKHSPRPWANDMGYVSSMPANDLVTIAVQRNSGFSGMQANANRIVACVNACEGVDTDDLTLGCYEKLLEKHVEVHFAKQDIEAQRDELLAKKLWVNWNAATGVPYISDFCESELAPEQLTADWVNRMVVERYELLRAMKDLLKAVNVRIDDPRIGQFDAARAAIAKAEGRQS